MKKGLTMLFFFNLLTGISPAQTGGENPGINPIHMLGSSHPGISVFCLILAVYVKGLTMLFFSSHRNFNCPNWRAESWN
jgi:hypothetical protein